MNAVGALQYPSTMSPVVGVDARDDGHMSLVTKDDAGDNDNSDVRKRRQSSDKKQLPSESHLSRTDPLYWFSGLPSQSLRMSQQYFKKSKKKLDNVDTLIVKEVLFWDTAYNSVLSF